ncbi:MAG: potassium channel family protein [Myxococcota bacterium]|nr:potassium channel family protein [Myxococcota bacterium]
MSTVVGAILILIVLREMFHQLFHPAGWGTLSESIVRGVFLAARAVSRRGGRPLELAGPVGLLSVILTWGALLAFGWALIYLPHLSTDFRFDDGARVAGEPRLVTGLYLSLVTLATLGYGDVTPITTWIRMLAPIEALMGFAWISAGITWVLSLFPVLARNRAFAQEVHLLAESDVLGAAGLHRLGETRAAALLERLRTQTITARIDMVHFSAAKYFRSGDDRTSLADAMHRLERLAREAQDASLPEPVQLQGQLLGRALEDIAQTLCELLLRCSERPTREALTAYRRFERVG